MTVAVAVTGWVMIKVGLRSRLWLRFAFRYVMSCHSCAGCGCGHVTVVPVVAVMVAGIAVTGAALEPVVDTDTIVGTAR